MSINVTGKSLFILFIISSVRHNSRWGILSFRGISTHYADSNDACVDSKEVSYSPDLSNLVQKILPKVLESTVSCYMMVTAQNGRTTV